MMTTFHINGRSKWFESETYQLWIHLSVSIAKVSIVSTLSLSYILQATVVSTSKMIGNKPLFSPCPMGGKN